MFSMYFLWNTNPNKSFLRFYSEQHHSCQWAGELVLVLAPCPDIVHVYETTVQIRKIVYPSFCNCSSIEHQVSPATFST